MPRVELPFADGFYVSQSGPLLEKRVVNVYPVIPEADAASNRVLFHTPGVTQTASVAGANSRGVLVFSDGTPYRVIGTTLYSFDSLSVATSHGSISGTTDVSMASNGINIAIVNPTGSSFFFTPSTNTLETIISSAFLSHGQATSVTFKDGFYVFTTNTVFFSSSDKTTNDGKDFNALDFEDAEISPDIIIKGFNDHNQLYILGTETTQVYRTIATSGFPFQLIPGAMIPKGCAARNSVISFDNSFLFMGGGKDERPAIYQALGSSIQRISTRSIEQLLHKLTSEEISNTRAFAYSENGSYFAVFTFGPHTFVYDQTTSRLAASLSWHERQTGVTDGTGFQKWRGVHGAEVRGKIQIGDDRSGLVGELDSQVFKEYGGLIERFWSTKPFIDRGNNIFSQSIELFMQTGLGNDDVTDPQIRMDYSDNGSRTFNSEISRSLGKVGEYNTEIKWKRLGSFPQSRVLRWKTTEPVPINVYALYGNAEATSSGG